MVLGEDPSDLRQVRAVAGDPGRHKLFQGHRSQFGMAPAARKIGRLQVDGGVQIVWAAPRPTPPEPFPASRTAAQWLVFLHDLYTGWGNRWSAP